jgi:putative endonuclease
MGFFVYLLKCSDGSYYVGVSNDPERRLQEHNAGKGPKWTADRRPVNKDLVPIFGSEGIVSEVLHKKRELNKKHIEKLSVRFHVSPAVFF